MTDQNKPAAPAGKPSRTPATHKTHTDTTLGRTKGGGAPRISRKVNLALDALTQGAKTQRQAAEIANMHETTLCKALRKPHVIAAFNHKKKDVMGQATVLREVGRARAIQVAIDLLENAQSDAVRARMVEFLASEARSDAPVVQVNVASGGYEYKRPTDPASAAIDVTPEEDQ